MMIEIAISYTDNFFNIPTVGGESNNSSGMYNNTYHQVKKNSQPEYARFNFTGTKLRFISTLYPSNPSYAYIKIDGVAHQFNIKGDLKYQAILYEITGLENKEHVVHDQVTSYKIRK